jgi:hypothetical protein
MPFGAVAGAPFLNNPMAAMGMQMTQSLMNDRMSGYLSWFSLDPFKYYFAVSNRYVVSKIRLLLFPLLHKSWKRERVELGAGLQTEVTGRFGSAFQIPRDDVNAPDLYLPTMGFVTYTLLFSIAFALQNTPDGSTAQPSGGGFHPGVIGLVASSTLVGLTLESLLLRSAFYFFGSASYTPSLIDLVCYAAYKYVHAIVVLLTHLLLGWPLLSYLCLLCCGLSAAVFMMRTLSRAMTPGMEGPPTAVHMGMTIAGEGDSIAKRKYYFAITGGLQLIIVYFLTRQALR